MDASGNSHRAELNVEKLWNPFLPGRGRLGLVELRSLRMPPTPERLVALAALFRALVARLVAHPSRSRSPTGGRRCTTSLALPHFLGQDLRAVLDDLSAHGLGPGAAPAWLLPEGAELARVEHAGTTLVVRRAVEFWPLLGDVACQEGAGAPGGRQHRAGRGAHHLPGDAAGAARRRRGRGAAQAAGGPRHVGAVRYRAFAPQPGLHPGLGPHDPLVLGVGAARRAVGIELHGWMPGGGGYDGLPDDAAEAARRCRERVVVRPGRFRPLRAPSGGLTLDLRRLPAALPT